MTLSLNQSPIVVREGVDSFSVCMTGDVCALKGGLTLAQAIEFASKLAPFDGKIAVITGPGNMIMANAKR